MKGSRPDHPQLCILPSHGLCKIKHPHLKNEMHKVVGLGREVEAQKNMVMKVLDLDGLAW